jgi:competence ComEA-like helix-hairpin-helix protein
MDSGATPMREAPSEAGGFRAGPRAAAIFALVAAALIFHAPRGTPGARRPITGGPSDRGPLRLDPNTATWTELACLPELGSARAMAIVRYREGQAESGVEGAIFKKASDLDRVPGIGPTTIESCRRLLRFPEEP